jgi:hypothetical protein
MVSTVPRREDGSAQRSASSALQSGQAELPPSYLSRCGPGVCPRSGGPSLSITWHIVNDHTCDKMVSTRYADAAACECSKVPTVDQLYEIGRASKGGNLLGGDHQELGAPG